MSLASPFVVGSIRIEPSRLRLTETTTCDDSTLDRLLVGLLTYEPRGERAADAGQEFRLIASDRLNRFSYPRFSEAVVRANLAQLWDELTAEYDKLDGRIAS
jgi:hypothetical protein